MGRKSLKTKLVNAHFKRRCVERLGYLLDEGELIRNILSGKLERYDKQSHRVTRWKWTDPVSGIHCILPYDKVRNQLITIIFDTKSGRNDGREGN